MRRSFFLAVLSFLLLSMQHEAQVHAFSHLAPQLARSHDTAFVSPHADDVCVECALLATGTAAPLGGQATIAASAPPAQLASAAFASRAADFPASFSSRAPPALL